MGQLIDVPEIGQVEFPDSMSDDDIVAAIKRNSQPEPPRLTLIERQNLSDVLNDQPEAPEPIRPSTIRGVSTTEGGPRLSLPEEFHNPLSEEENPAIGRSPLTDLGITPENVQAAFDWTGAPKALTTVPAAVDKTIAGIADWMTTPNGMIQMAAAGLPPLKIPMALKFAKDMIEGGAMNAKAAYEAVKRGDVQGIADNVVGAAANFFGAGAIGLHGKSEVQKYFNHEKGEPNAGTIRGNQEINAQEGKVPQGSENVSRENLQQPPPGTPEPVAERVAPRPSAPPSEVSDEIIPESVKGGPITERSPEAQAEQKRIAEEFKAAIKKENGNEIQLGLNRPEVENPNLRQLSDEDFDREYRASKKEVTDAEKVLDEVADTSDLTKEQRQKIAASQDKWTATELERFRRNYSDIHTEDIFHKMIELADIGHSYPKFKILAQIVRERGGAKPHDVVGIYRMLPESIKGNPDFKEALGGKLGKFKQWLDRVSKESSPLPNPSEAAPLKPESQNSPAEGAVSTTSAAELLPIEAARKNVADEWRRNAKAIRSEDEYASHVTAAQKDKYLSDALKYADEIEKGLHEGNFTIGQRIHYEMTGKSVPLLPSESAKPAPAESAPVEPTGNEPWAMTFPKWMNKAERQIQLTRQPEVAQPTPRSREKISIETRDGMKSVNATPYFLPNYKGPTLAVVEYKAPKGMPQEKGYRVYTKDSGGLVEDSNGVSTLNETLQEAVQRLRSVQEKSGINSYQLVHRHIVNRALREGKTVPPEVLKDYPELAAKQPPQPTPAAKPVEGEVSSDAVTERAWLEGKTIGELSEKEQKAHWLRLGGNPGKVKLAKPEEMAAGLARQIQFAIEHKAQPTDFSPSRQPTPATVKGGEQKYRVQSQGPQLHTLVEKLPASETEIANGEQPVRVRNDKTGVESTVLESDLTPVKEGNTPKATKRDLDAELKAAGYPDPSAFPNKASKEAALKRAKLIGLGGALHEGEPGKPPLASLTDAVRSLAEASPKPEYKAAYNLGQTLSDWKDSANKAVDGLKAAAGYAKEKIRGLPKWDSFKTALGRRQLSLTESALNARDFVKNAVKGIPNQIDREAIANWVDHGGDKASLTQARDAAKPRYRAGYEKALNLPPELETTAKNIQNYFEARLADAQEAGILSDGIENYIHRTYESDSPWKKGILAELRSGVFTGKPALAKARSFKLDSEAEAAGYKPVKDFTKRVAAYDMALNKSIADRQFVKEAMQWKLPDGRPAIDAAGTGTPVEAKPGDSGVLLIKPQFKRGDTKNPKNNRSDYIALDHPALRKWKWVTEENGKPVMVQGDVLIHPDALTQIKAVFGRSRIRQNPLGRAALGMSSTIKQTMLDLSGFHPVQIMVHGWEHRTFKPVDKIDTQNPEQAALISHGLVAGETSGQEMFSEGLSGSSLSRHIPYIGEKLQNYNEWLFQDYIPRLKMAMGLHALERNRARYAKELASGKMTDDQVLHLTANQANAAFGELNYEMMGRNKTMQDALRLGLLAPDFLEARGKFVAQSLQRGGESKAGFLGANEQRQALFLGAATLYVTARIINKLLDDQYHFEPKNAFNVVFKNKAYSLRTVQGDLLHAFTEPAKFVYGRLNPLYGRTTLEFLTHRDAFGRTRTGLEQLKDLATTAVPISLRGLVNPSEQNLWESFLNAFGVTERRSTPIDTVYDLSQKFKEKHKISEPGEFIYDREKDPYRAVKLALIYGTPDKAAQEMALAIRDGKTDTTKLEKYFKQFGTHPFTGSQKHEKEFVASLSRDELKTYQDAVKERKKMRDNAAVALRTYGKYLSQQK